MILKALWHQVENKEKEREVAEQEKTQEDNSAGPSRAQDAPAGPSRAQDAGGLPQPVILQQTDGMARSTPSRIPD